jgi:type I restriction enzyme M protein
MDADQPTSQQLNPAALAALTKEARALAGQAEDIENAVYDLKAVNPNARNEEDARTPEELLDLIEAKGREITDALAVLRRGAADP